MPYNQYTSNRKPEIPRPDHDEIVDILYNKMLIDKVTTIEIVKWLCETSGYNYSLTYAYELIKDTKDYIRTLRTKVNKNSLEDSLDTLLAQEEAAIARGENRLALDIRREINKISGLYKERIEINQDVTFKVRWGS